MKKTSLYQLHLKFGAKMTSFADFELPLHFRGIRIEHEAVRKRVGMFDVSHMGKIVVMGSGASSLLSYVTPTNIEKRVSVGECVYTAFLNEEGFIIDDTIIGRFQNNSYIVVPNAINTEAIYNFLQEHSYRYDVSIENASEEMSIIAVQGPCSSQLFKDIFGRDPPEKHKLNIYRYRDYRSFEEGLYVSGTGYTGEKGFEIIVRNEHVEDLWMTFIKYGEKYSLELCGLGARDILRMEKGMLLSGQDFNIREFPKTPLQAGIGWIIDYDHEFLGKENLVRMKSEKNYDVFRGFICEGKRIPRPGFEIFDSDNNRIGVITSGGFSPELNRPIALGYIGRDYQKPGTKVILKKADVTIEAEVRHPRIVPDEDKLCVF